MFDIIKVCLAIVVTLLLISNRAHAATRMGKTTSDVYFKADGKRVTAVEADELAKNHTIEKCTPVKNTEPPSYKCNEVVKEYNPKNGNPTWKKP